MDEPTAVAGRDSEDLSLCGACGFQTYEALSQCPKCGGVLLSRRWTRRFGAVLVVLGAFLALGTGGLLLWMWPMLSHPGVEVGGQTFNGSPKMALGIALLLGTVVIFGLAAIGNGVWQIRTGRRNMKAVGAMVGIAGLLYVGALLFQGFGG